METVKFKVGELEVEMPENTFKEYIDPTLFKKLIRASMQKKKVKWHQKIGNSLVKLLPFIPKIVAVFK